MSKFNRREFLKLSAIWGTVPLLPGWLSFKEGVPEEEEPEEEAKPSPWNEGYSTSPYHLHGGTSIRWRAHTSIDSDANLLVAWYNDKEEPTK